MILANGKLFDSSMQNEILEKLETSLNNTIASQSLKTESVISALDSLSDRIASGTYSSITGMAEHAETISLLLKRDSLEYKIKTELGENVFQTIQSNPPFGKPFQKAY